METSTKTRKSPYDIIKGENGVVVSYMPKMEGIAAVVDLKTLIRITGGLRKFKFEDTKTVFCSDLMGSKDIEEYISLLKEELAFQMTCNKILTTSFEEARAEVIKAENQLMGEKQPLTERDINELKELS